MSIAEQTEKKVAEVSVEATEQTISKDDEKGQMGEAGLPPKEFLSQKPEEEKEESPEMEKKEDKMEQEEAYMMEKKKMAEENAAIKKQLDMVVNELNNMKKEKQSNDRTNHVMEKLGMKKEEALPVVNALSALDDESFASAVNIQSDYYNKKMSEYKSGKTVNEEVPSKDPEEDKKKNPSENVEVSEDPSDVKASISVLETAEVKSDAALATSESSNGVKQVASQIASYFGLETSATE